MPTILRIADLRPHFYSGEGTEPPHVHVRCPEGECKLWLPPVALARNRGIPAHRLREIERLTFDHRELFPEKLDEYRNR